jgi:hypothetical protein
MSLNNKQEYKLRVLSDDFAQKYLTKESESLPKTNTIEEQVK